MDEHKPQTLKPLDRYLSVIDVWAMAFGCMVGWGVFAMPGTTFLPVAGPLGTVCSMLIGMVIMLIIAGNLSYMMGRSSVTGGIRKGSCLLELLVFMPLLSYYSLSERHCAVLYRPDTIL